MAKHVDLSISQILNFFKNGSTGTEVKQKASISVQEMLDYLAAATNHPGLIELATTGESETGTDAARAVTPAGAKAAVATHVQASIVPMTFDGKDGAGACTATGLAVDDVVIAVVGIIGELGDVASKFESVITVADQIQQSSATNLSGNDYLAIVYSP